MNETERGIIQPLRQSVSGNLIGDEADAYNVNVL